MVALGLNIVSELIKQRYNAGLNNKLYFWCFWRDNVGHEVDVHYATSNELQVSKH